jgi:transcriptional regulator with XRE-family HTH domain
MPQVSSLFVNLKKELKLKGLTYKDVAEYLDLTETTVKRMFSNEDISLKRLDKICELLSIDLADLTRIGKSESRAIEVLTEEQERQIVSDERMVAVSFLVHQGWTFDELIKHFNFTETELIRKLALLDKLGLMELLPKNKIKIKVSRHLRWRKKGPIQRYFVKHFQASFMNSFFCEENEYLRLISGMYTPLTCSIIMKKMQKLAFEIYQLSQEDMKIPLEDRIPFGVLIAARPWHAEFFNKMRRKEIS